MRKQYHLWREDGPLLAWDVDRLIELSRDLPVEQIDLNAIRELDSAYWFDRTQGPPTVRRIVEHLELIQRADTSYPIILAADGRVMDGMHRVARALLEGRSQISARRFRDQPEPDFRDCHPDDLPY